MKDVLLALNAGSSSLKFAVAEIGKIESPLIWGRAERLGSKNGFIEIETQDGELIKDNLDNDQKSAMDTLFNAIKNHHPKLYVRAVGHRIVHGGQYFNQPVEITPSTLAELENLVPLAPLHQPHGIEGVRRARALFPDADQVACFDTAFHADKPWVHSSFALPAQYYDKGLRRYGFHGLACQSICDTLEKQGYPLKDRSIAIAHLGNGCSVTAVQNGKSIATSMGFSALDGLAMGTRCGHMDPGAILHLLRSGHDVASLERLLYHEAGLLGLSGLSNDMRDLTASDEATAKLAIEYFVARGVEEICRMAGAMGGLDCVVFSGGIGENAPHIREAISGRLKFLPGREKKGIEFLVIPAKEEHQILVSTSHVQTRKSVSSP